MDCIVYHHLTNFWQTSIKEKLYLKTFLILLFKEIDPSLSINRVWAERVRGGKSQIIFYYFKLNCLKFCFFSQKGSNIFSFKKSSVVELLISTVTLSIVL